MMKRSHRIFTIGLIALALLTTAVAQNVVGKATSDSEKGFSSYSSFTEGHDSSLGWSTALASSIGYDFNRHFSVGVGVPVYLVQPYSRYKTSSDPGVSYNSLGDVFMNLNYKAKGSQLSYAGAITGTAPTGDTKHGVSTGRATIDLNNHLEHDIWRLTPFVEAGIGNSNTTETLLGHGAHGMRTGALRDYTTLGGMSHYRAGVSMDLGKNVSFDASAYDELPFGDQKVYSRILQRNTTTAMSHRNGFESSALIAGNSSIAADHGFSGGLSFNPSRHIDMGLDYTRSINYHLDTVELTVGYRFGHMAPKTTPK